MTHEEVQDLIDQALENITIEISRGWYGETGYTTVTLKYRDRVISTAYTDD